MKEIQLSNFKVSLDEERLRFSTVAGTWAMEISILSPRYIFLSYLVGNPEKHSYLENYIRFNYLMSESVYLDATYVKDITTAYNNVVTRYNDKFGKKEDDNG